MSGGVDSSVCAVLLKEQGHEVIGLFMRNWDEKDENGVCQASKEYEDVIKVCDKIGIPYYSVDFIKEYQDEVFSHFLKEYKQGHTPNPDILCNREIKFKVFFNEAMRLGADYLATGHYCQIDYSDGECFLTKGADPQKDQSYFLNAIDGSVLDRVLFPIGHMQKSHVRELAKKYGLSTQDKKDSTGICFIGERNFRKFLSGYIDSQKGFFKNLDGTIVGKHLGTSFYTIGQRKGLGLGGEGEPWFVVEKDTQNNIVYVERGEHPKLYSQNLTATELNWISKEVTEFPYYCKAKIRYRQSDQDCIITKAVDGRLFVDFIKPQRAITPRQSIVFYDHEKCLGGALIEAANYQ